MPLRVYSRELEIYEKALVVYARKFNKQHEIDTCMLFSTHLLICEKKDPEMPKTGDAIKAVSADFFYSCANVLVLHTVFACFCTFPPSFKEKLQT